MTGWRELAKDQLAVKGAETRKRGSGGSAVTSVSRVGFAPAVTPLLVRAAQRRGISIAGYIRRATMAFVAEDLGLDPVELFDKDMAPSPFNRGGMYSDKDLTGERFGQWRALPDGSHRTDD